MFLNLVLCLNLWFFWWVDLAEEFRMPSLNACPSLSKNGSETELFTGIFWLESLNSIVQDPSCQITDIEYWSAKSFPRISGVPMPLTTYASTLILMKPSGVWKYKSISTYPEMDAFPVTWTKLTYCPCWSLMGVCISESDFCKIRVMSDPESIMTLVRFLSRKLTVAGTWAAEEPRKEHPRGRAWYFLDSTSGLDLGELLEIEWWTLANSWARHLLAFKIQFFRKTSVATVATLVLVYALLFPSARCLADVWRNSKYFRLPYHVELVWHHVLAVPHIIATGLPEYHPFGWFLVVVPSLLLRYSCRCVCWQFLQAWNTSCISPSCQERSCRSCTAWWIFSSDTLECQSSFPSWMG